MGQTQHSLLSCSLLRVFGSEVSKPWIPDWAIISEKSEPHGPVCSGCDRKIHSVFWTSCAGMQRITRDSFLPISIMWLVSSCCSASMIPWKMRASSRVLDPRHILCLWELEPLKLPQFPQEGHQQWQWHLGSGYNSPSTEDTMTFSSHCHCMLHKLESDISLPWSFLNDDI